MKQKNALFLLLLLIGAVFGTALAGTDVTSSTATTKFSPAPAASFVTEGVTASVQEADQPKARATMPTAAVDQNINLKPIGPVDVNDTHRELGYSPGFLTVDATQTWRCEFIYPHLNTATTASNGTNPYRSLAYTKGNDNDTSISPIFPTTYAGLTWSYVTVGDFNLNINNWTNSSGGFTTSSFTTVNNTLDLAGLLLSLRRAGSADLAPVNVAQSTCGDNGSYLAFVVETASALPNPDFRCEESIGTPFAVHHPDITPRNSSVTWMDDGGGKNGKRDSYVFNHLNRTDNNGVELNPQKAFVDNNIGHRLRWTSQGNTIDPTHNHRVTWIKDDDGEKGVLQDIFLDNANVSNHLAHTGNS